MNKTKLFAMVLLLLACSMTTRAARWTDSGMYDTSWYSDLGSTFEISTPRQLAGLAYFINNGKVRFFNLQGVELQRQAKGLNIVRRADGSTQEVMAKP